MPVGFIILGIFQMLFYQKCSATNNKGTICMSVYGGYGVCVPIQKCERLDKILTRLITSVKFVSRVEGELLDKSHALCKLYPSDYVCCPFDDISREADSHSNSIFPKPPNPTITTLKESRSVLPSTAECGLDVFRDKIYSGSETGLEDFPWVALIQYYRYRTDRYTFDCGGSLISRRYVLTVAHCLTGDILIRIGSPVSVRLGEYDLSTDDDCTLNRKECTQEQHLDIGIEALISHPSFNKGSNTKQHDIGLIRMIEDVDFTLFIRPICLTDPYVPQPRANTSVQVAGFGRTLTSQLSNIKQKLQLPIFDHQKCVTQFRTNLTIYLSEYQICAGGQYKRDTCLGDSGAALVQYRDRNWYAIGVVSFGIKCGLSNWPGVYTYVPNYINWIIDNMKM